MDTFLDPFNVPWGFSGGPSAFTQIAEGLKYASNALDTDAFYPVSYENWKDILVMSSESFQNLSNKSYAIHLWAEMYRRENVRKGSAIEKASWSKDLLKDYPY